MIIFCNIKTIFFQRSSSYSQCLHSAPTYPSTPQFPAHGFQSSGHKALLLVHRPDHGTGRSTDGREPRMR